MLALDRVLQLGARVECQIVYAIESLGSGSEALISQILWHEQVINALEIEIDALVGQIIARQQPAARDLRLLMAIIKTTTNLERIGDEAKKIALRARHIFLAGQNVLSRYTQIRHLARMVLSMLHASLLAFENKQVEGANGVADLDRDVDEVFRNALRERISFMIDDPRTISVSLDIVFVAKSLERIGDHAKNIAEQVIYAIDGRDIRHASELRY